MEEQISVPLSEFSLLVCVLSAPIFLLSLLLSVFVLRRRNRSWIFCGVWVALGLVANPLIAIVLWLGTGHLAAHLPLGGMTIFLPALIAAFVTTAPAFLVQHNRTLTLHSRNEA